ncbi:MAG: hypothetical protein OIF38_12220 [Cellvibrionaceae bacterium]|nr:hypothetical protein [Cellvibrionaceae bacterium]
MPRLLTLLLPLLALGLAACEKLPGPSKSIEVARQGSHMGRLSPNGSHAVIGSINHGGSLWQVGQGERLFDWNHGDAKKTTLEAAAFSPEGDWAMTTDGITLVLWQVSTGIAHRYWTAPGEVLSLALGPKGNFALLGLADHSAVIFDSKRGGVKRRFAHQGRVRSVDVSADGKLALTGAEDNRAVLWDIQRSKALHRFDHEEEVQLVRFSPKANVVFTAAMYDKAVVWNAASGKPVGTVPFSTERIKRGMRFSAARFSSSGRYLLIGRPDQMVQLWDTKTMKALAKWQVLKRDAWKPTSAAVQDVAFAPAKRTYYAIASNGFVHTLKR